MAAYPNPDGNGLLPLVGRLSLFQRLRRIWYPFDHPEFTDLKRQFDRAGTTLNRSMEVSSQCLHHVIERQVQPEK